MLGVHDQSCYCKRGQTKEDLLDACTKITDYAGDVKTVYTKASIQQILTESRIAEILQCNCKQHDYTSLNGNGLIVGAKFQQYTSVLALLCLTDSIHLLPTFMQKKWTDDRLTKTPLTQDDLQELVPETCDYTEKRKERILDQFKDFEARVFLPTLSDQHQDHIHFEDGRILPLDYRPLKSKDRLLGKGAFSIVYAATLLPGYWQFRDIKDGEIALKLLKAEDDPEKFLQTEKSQVMQWHDHPYIVPVQASFTYRDSWMLIYPRAECDLEKLLLNEVPDEYQGTSGADRAWKSLMYVLSALAHVHNSNPKRRGYHLDIMPRNILVFVNGIWAISDFGLAVSRIVVDNDPRSDISKHSGNERYRSPDDRPHRNFDVWAMACIALEVFVWLNKGPAGVVKFRESRLERDGIMVTDNFHIDRRLKQPVCNLLLEMEATNLQAKQISGVLRGMLDIDPSEGHRLSSYASAQRLSNILGEDISEQFSEAKTSTLTVRDTTRPTLKERPAPKSSSDESVGTGISTPNSVATESEGIPQLTLSDCGEAPKAEQ